ncbi:hypothetical protein [Arenibacter troitsensis]|uniref:hypothetical protein n=1 Tax=Arenibacter troitsensis TaxID=188872 RepID=UPI00159413F7|nr:hypothetical protein [Arenibacter troitsensis]
MRAIKIGNSWIAILDISVEIPDVKLWILNIKATNCSLLNNFDFPYAQSPITSLGGWAYPFRSGGRSRSYNLQ